MSLIVGLDIGTSAVRAALLQGGKKGAPVLKRYGEVALPPGAVDGGEIVEPEVVQEAIAQLWKRAKLPKKNVVLGLANQRIIVRPVDVPALSDEALRDSLGVHVGDFIPMPVDEAVLDFLPLGGVLDEDQSEVDEEGVATLGTRPILVVAAQRQMVDELLAVVEAAGLKVIALDLQAFALVRAVYGARIPLGEPPEAIVSIGAGLTQVVITRDGEAVFFRLVPFGGNEFTEALTEGLGIDADEAEELKRRVGVHAVDAPESSGDSVEDQARDILTATANRLIDEIRGSLEFFGGTQSDSGAVSELKISGNAARLPHLAARMSKYLEIRLTPVKLLGEAVEVGKTGLTEEQLAQVQPVLPVAVGLAEWGLV
jgi:type IV pilus assembly protein PilM